MPGSGMPTVPSSYSPGGVIVMPPVASVIPKPLERETPPRWKKRKTAGSRNPAAESPHASRPPVISRIAAASSSAPPPAPARRWHLWKSCCQRAGMLMSPVGRTRRKPARSVSSDGFPAKTYVPPQNIIPRSSR